MKKTAPTGGEKETGREEIDNRIAGVRFSSFPVEFKCVWFKTKIKKET